MKSMLQLFASLACALALTACGGGSNDTTTTTPTQPAFTKTDTVVGTGIEAIAGDQLTVNYTGWLYSDTASDHKGTQFESSKDTGTPFTFTLGKGTVIGGWEQGIPGMKAGGKRTLIIPSDLAYGATGSGTKIPANQALVFDIELISIKR
ncbi:FKBP-type peptidyl-prolyl cis-trans isomerase [Pseudoduganella sp. RAF53_2]|uniref:FKBP-type peptidyl-prolyl cis-trans isomerase n=1 Tax=unclassified Pseudoduganella TaxID=2637179 RepID=UPI003F98E4B9